MKFTDLLCELFSPTGGDGIPGAGAHILMLAVPYLVYMSYGIHVVSFMSCIPSIIVFICYWRYWWPRLKIEEKTREEDSPT